jgi:hypothetical protein
MATDLASSHTSRVNPSPYNIETNKQHNQIIYELKHGVCLKLLHFQGSGDTIQRPSVAHVSNTLVQSLRLASLSYNPKPSDISTS